MKSGAPSHPKMIALSITLKIPVYAAVGIMEMLWHFADKHAIQGDIGKYPDQVLAQSVGWDRPPEELIAALVACRWLDRSEKHRLLIHDWDEHCQDYCKKRLKSLKLSIHRSESSTCGVLEFSGNFQNFPQDSEKFSQVDTNLPPDRLAPEPPKSIVSSSNDSGYKIPENSGNFQKKGVGGAYSIAREVVVVKEGKTPPTPSNAENGFGDHDLFETLYAAHPQAARRERGIAEKYFVQSIAAGCDPAEIIRVHGLMCATEDWQWKHGAKAPTLGQWLLDKGWKYPPNGHANGNSHKPIEVCPSCQKKPCECGERFRKHAMQSGEQMIAAKRERANGKV